MASIKDVAEYAGVSIATVSRVINKAKPVSPPVRARVEEAISALDYHPNNFARGLKVLETKQIAVIISSISRIFFTTVIEGIDQEASEFGYSIILAETQDDLKREMDLVESFSKQWVDGIILVSSVTDEAASADYIKKLGNLTKKGTPIPVVTLEIALGSDRIDAVTLDYEKAAYEAVSLLINNTGRKNIVHIAHPKGNRIGDERRAGYQRALRSAGLTVSEDYILDSSFSTYSGYMAMKDFLKKRLPADALYCANDQTAVGAMKACQEMGLQIPDDIAIMGTDDVIVSSIVSPTLSTISIPKFEMGKQALRILLDRIKNGYDTPRINTVLDYTIIERESTHKGAQNSLKHLLW